MLRTFVEVLFRWELLSGRKGDSGFVCAECIWHGHGLTNLNWKERRLTCTSKRNLSQYFIAMQGTSTSGTTAVKTG